MSSALRTRNAALLVIAAAFTLAFSIVTVPALFDGRPGGVIEALFDEGFANPFAAGYALDVWFTGGALLAWIVYEARVHQVRRGWIAAVLCFAPGVAVGLVAYLVIREPQLRTERSAAAGA